MAFEFQGNQNKFDIDDYLTRYPNIYWSVSRLGREIRIGDQIFIWRSGVSAGAVFLMMTFGTRVQFQLLFPYPIEWQI